MKMLIWMLSCVEWTQGTTYVFDGSADASTGRDSFRGVYGPLQSILFCGLGKRMRGAKTVGQTLTIYSSYDVCLRPLEIAIRLFTIYGYNPPKPPFGGVYRHFQAKLIKYQHLHIIKTTASIPTKVCTAIKDHSVVGCPNMLITINNPRWRTIAILKI